MHKKNSIVVILLAGIITFGIISVASADFTEVYSTDFESDISSVWSNSSSMFDEGVNSTYHGKFTTQDSTTLTLTGLPSHTLLSLEFDLYLFNTWDGNNTTYGPDYFSLTGDVTGSWTFTNHQTEGQTYPGTPSNIIGSGQSATHIYRGLDPTGSGDGFLIERSGSTFTVTFGGPTTQTDEQWGIDNVRVSINSTSVTPEKEQEANFRVEIIAVDPPHGPLDEIGIGELFRVRLVYEEPPTDVPEPILVRSLSLEEEIEVIAEPTDMATVYMSSPIRVSPQESLVQP